MTATQITASMGTGDTGRAAERSTALPTPGRRPRRRGQWAAWAFLAPVVVYLVVFYAYPLYRNLDLSLRDYTVRSFIDGKHVRPDWSPPPDIAKHHPKLPRVIRGGTPQNPMGEAALTLDGGGIIDYCRLNDITIQAWSPFQAGFFNGVFLGSPEYPELNAVIDRLAAAYHVPPIAIATAWITRHPADMRVVLGTTTPERVAAAAQGSDVSLTRAEWYELFRAAGYRVP